MKDLKSVVLNQTNNQGRFHFFQVHSLAESLEDDCPGVQLDLSASTSKSEGVIGGDQGSSPKEDAKEILLGKHIQFFSNDSVKSST